MAVGPLGQIHITVTDIDASVAFYRDVLGVPFLSQPPGQSIAYFQSGDVRIYLGIPGRPDFASKVSVYFTVDDIDAEFARLRAAGVPVTGEPHVVHRDDAVELWLAAFTDPDGHNIVLMRRR
jgi:catechol 2,3-dioxygenase-like lactoylglutathione lyase family enzyme